MFLKNYYSSGYHLTVAKALLGHKADILSDYNDELGESLSKQSKFIKKKIVPLLMLAGNKVCLFVIFYLLVMIPRSCQSIIFIILMDFIIAGLCKSSELLTFIQRLVPDARLVEEIGTEMTFILPVSDDYVSQMTRLFEELDANKSRLHIHTYGLSDTTLEEVCFYYSHKL